VSSGEGLGAAENGNRRARLQAIDVDELAELHLVAENDVVLVGGKTRVDRVRGVGDFDVEALFGDQILLVEVGGDDVGDLQERAPVLARRFHASVEAVEELQHDSRSECCHNSDVMMMIGVLGLESLEVGERDEEKNEERRSVVVFLVGFFSLCFFRETSGR